MASCDLNLDLLIEAETLSTLLDHPKIRIVDLTRLSVYRQLHIANAVHVQPKQLVAHNTELASGLLPDRDSIQALIEHLNLSPEHHVVAYDDEGGAWASRLLWNLHCGGFERTSLLNGGIHAWLALGYPVTASMTQIEPVSHFYQATLQHDQSYRIDYASLRQQVEKQSIQLWDCRSLDEYTGQKLAARRGGHIPNAIHYAWDCAFDRENHLKLYALVDIRHHLQDIGFDLTQPVVVYCQSHHRSSLAYLLGRLLNWNIRAYDGAWSEWGNIASSPIVSGEKPL